MKEFLRKVVYAITYKIKNIPLLRLVFFVLAISYLAKNLYSYEGSWEDPVLTPDQQKLVDEQSVKNWQRSKEMFYMIGVLLIPLAFLKYINYKQEKSDLEMAEKKKQLEDLENTLKEVREANRKTKIQKQEESKGSKKKK